MSCHIIHGWVCLLGGYIFKQYFAAKVLLIDPFVHTKVKKNSKRSTDLNVIQQSQSYMTPIKRIMEWTLVTLSQTRPSEMTGKAKTTRAEVDRSVEACSVLWVFCDRSKSNWGEGPLEFTCRFPYIQNNPIHFTAELCLLPYVVFFCPIVTV